MTRLLEHNDLPGLQALAHQLLGTCGGHALAPFPNPPALEQSIQGGQSRKSIPREMKSLIGVIRRVDGFGESKEAAGGHQDRCSRARSEGYSD